MRANNKEFYARIQAKEEMKVKGDFHNWIKIPCEMGEEMLVCSKTGWCPSKDAFLSMEYVNKWIQQKKLDEEYQAFRKIRVETLAEAWEMTVPQLEGLINEIFKIKQDFHTQKMEKSITEMKKVIGDKKDGKEV